MKKLFVLSLLAALAGCHSATESDPTARLNSYAADASVSSSGASSSGSSSSGNSSGPGSASTPAPKAGMITAGEWKDLSNWSFWQTLLQKDEWSKLVAAWHYAPGEQYDCLVKAANGQPATDVRLIVRDGRQQVVWEGTTDGAGRVQITPQLFDGSARGPFEVRAVVGQQTLSLGSLDSSEGDLVLHLPTTKAPPASVVDVQLVVDATGSMGDEMEYLKNELNDVITQAQQQLPSTTFRVGSVFYRDKGDEYLTRPFPFTSDLKSVVAFIGQQRAGGGGDFPEAVDEGLEAGLNQQWSTSARSRILFLVLDAPPHNTPETIERMTSLVKRAGRQGIRIIPVTASGIDKSTEFLMRSMAIGTQGTYVFITNHSGIGNNHLEPTTGPYNVEYLNELMTRLIVKYSNP